MSGYRTESADATRDRERILALWARGLSHRGKPEAKFDWYYLRNPAGTPALLFLFPEDGAEPVGVASVGARVMRDGDSAVDAGWLADFVVATEHRSFFPALALQRAVQKEGVARHELLISMPNPRSEAVVLRCGSRRVGDVVRRVRVVHAREYLARYMPRWLATVAGAVVDVARRVTSTHQKAGDFKVEWVERPDARFDDLWRRAAPRGVLSGVRDAKYLAWRFSDCPLQSYRFLTLTAGPDRRLVAYAACSRDGTALEVADFLVDRAHADAGQRLWDEIADAAWREGCASASVAFLGPNAIHQELETAGWVQRSRRSFIASVAGRQELLSPERWFMTPADEDG